MTKTVREFSPVGPCIVQGTLLRETAKFYVFDDRFNPGRERRLSKRTDDHYSPAHIEPCPSCQDHARTQYPNGYEN